MKSRYENWAISSLEKIIEVSNRDRDALPGSAVKHIKEALKIMRKRRRD